jgi:uncharacterized protein (TIGR02466 family)
MPSTIQTWFPTSIYVTDEVVTPEYINTIKNKCLAIFSTISHGAENWNCNTFNTLGTYDVKSDEIFVELIKTIEFHVNQFAEYHGSNFSYNCKDSWINMNYKNTYQEYHCHANSTFSAVYYISTPSKSGRIIFENPTEPDMVPIKNISDPTEASYRTCHYSPTENTLLIFRSYLRHMVELGQNEEPRISIALNF